MAIMAMEGLEELALDLEELANMPVSVLDDMLNAGGEVLKKGQSKTAESMLQGPYYAGGVAGGVALTKPRKHKDGRALFITFKGFQHNNRLAEIAFVNEFGKKKQPPRPFIRTANEQHADEAISAEEKIYDDYLTRKGF